MFDRKKYYIKWIEKNREKVREYALQYKKDNIEVLREKFLSLNLEITEDAEIKALQIKVIVLLREVISLLTQLLAQQ